MSRPEPTYDLTLLLDPQAEDSLRAKIVADAVSAIESRGQLVNQASWGERPLSYPLEKHSSAEYHLLQFQAPVKDLLASLDRTLRITDGVLRFRIIKLDPGTPAAPDMGVAVRRAEQAGEPAPEPTEAPAPAVAAEPA